MHTPHIHSSYPRQCSSDHSDLSVHAPLKNNDILFRIILIDQWHQATTRAQGQVSHGMLMWSVRSPIQLIFEHWNQILRNQMEMSATARTHLIHGRVNVLCDNCLSSTITPCVPGVSWLMVICMFLTPPLPTAAIASKHHNVFKVQIILQVVGHPTAQEDFPAVLDSPP